MASSVAITRKTSKQKGWQPEQDSGPEQTGAMLTVTVRGRSGGNLFGLISLIFYLVLSFLSVSIFTTALFNAGIDACCLVGFFIVF